MEIQSFMRNHSKIVQKSRKINYFSTKNPRIWLIMESNHAPLATRRAVPMGIRSVPLLSDFPLWKSLLQKWGLCWSGSLKQTSQILQPKLCSKWSKVMYSSTPTTRKSPVPSQYSENWRSSTKLHANFDKKCTRVCHKFTVERSFLPILRPTALRRHDHFGDNF